MAELNKATSQYADTPVANEYITYLDIWVPKEIPESVNDEEITIESKYHTRPDLLANELYGTPRLWWVFAVRNKDVLIDPIEDFTSGTKIFITPKNIIERVI